MSFLELLQEATEVSSPISGTHPTVYALAKPVDRCADFLVVIDGFGMVQVLGARNTIARQAIAEIVEQNSILTPKAVFGPEVEILDSGAVHYDGRHIGVVTNFGGQTAKLPLQKTDDGDLPQGITPNNAPIKLLVDANGRLVQNAASGFFDRVDGARKAFVESTKVTGKSKAKKAEAEALAQEAATTMTMLEGFVRLTHPEDFDEDGKATSEYGEAIEAQIRATMKPEQRTSGAQASDSGDPRLGTGVNLPS